VHLKVLNLGFRSYVRRQIAKKVFVDQGDVELTIPQYLPLSITYFFKVDGAIKSVIDSYYLTKGKKDGIDSEK
jgi:hypothetical protein